MNVDRRHVFVNRQFSFLRELRLAEKFEVAVARHSRSTEVVLNDENRDCGVPRNDDGPDHAGFGKYHVVAFFADAAEAVGPEHSDESL